MRVRPELSRKNPLYISKHEFYTDKRHMIEFNKRKSAVDIGDVHNAELFIMVDDVENQMHE